MVARLQHGGTPEGAEAYLFQSIADGTAYLNIHTSMFLGGEIRGFFAPGGVPVAPATWGALKANFH